MWTRAVLPRVIMKVRHGAYIVTCSSRPRAVMPDRLLAKTRGSAIISLFAGPCPTQGNDGRWQR